MRLLGVCDFCKTKGNWEGGIFHDRGKNFSEVIERPPDWAAVFPWNRKELPKGCNMAPESLEEHGITTRVACPDCLREDPYRREA